MYSTSILVDHDFMAPKVESHWFLKEKSWWYQKKNKKNVSHGLICTISYFAPAYLKYILH